MNRLKTFALALVAAGFVLPATSQAAPDRDKDKDKGQQASTYQGKAGDGIGDCSPGTAQADLDANNVRARIFNNGGLFYRDNAVYEVPRGSGINSVFASGIWIGGKVAGELRVAHAQYEDFEFWPGPLGPDGGAPTAASCAQYDRFWKISQDDLDQYEDSGATTNDLLTWPAELGAPVLTTTANGFDDDGDNLVDEGFDAIDNDEDGKIDERDEQEFVVNSVRLAAGRPIYDLADGDRPDIIGTQSIWWIMNDRGNAHTSSETPPIGLEVTGQAFAFATSNAINNTTFYKYNVRYRGDAPLLDAYLALWSDPDLGTFNDDYVGSDTELGLGFVYNADDFDDPGGPGYGDRPPALGYDYFQGPLVNNDGVDNDDDGEIDEDDERIALSTFIYYNNNSDPVNGNVANGEDAYNYFRGIWRNGQPVTIGGAGTNPTGVPTTIMFPGDPPEFWSEYDSSPEPGEQPNTPDDRRFLMASGPFIINDGDEQEIVFGIVWSQAQSGGALASLAKLKADDILAQGAFDNDFEVPRPPDAPIVNAQPLDGAVALTWTNPRTSNNYLNAYDVFNPFSDPLADDRTYTLEGYEVYRFDSPAQSLDQATRLAVFDRANGITTVTDQVVDSESGVTITAVTARGIDNGLQNSFTVEGLVNNQTYFFAVRAYAYNAASPGERIYSSPVLFGTNLVSVIPSKQNSVRGGTVINADTGDLLPVIVSATDARGPIQARVVDPAAITGDTYEARFVNYDPGTPDDDTDDFLIYNVFNVRTGALVFDGEDFAQRTGSSPIASRRDADGGFASDDRVPTIDGFVLDLKGLAVGQTETYAPGCADLEDARSFIKTIGDTDGRPLQRVLYESVNGASELPFGSVTRFYSVGSGASSRADTLFFPAFVDEGGDAEIAYNFVETVRPGGGPACDSGVAGLNQQGCDQSGGVWVYAANRTYAEDVPASLNNGVNSTGVYHVTSGGAGPEQAGANGLGYFDAEATPTSYAPNDYEIRFTGSSYATHLFGEGSLLDDDDNIGYEVPFEVWDIGNTPVGGVNDPSDDVRMIPVMFSEAFQRTGEEIADLCDGFIYQDPEQFGTNPNNVPPNPITDRIFAYYPTTTYDAWAAQAEAILFPYVEGTVVQIVTSEFAAVRGNAEAEQDALDLIAAVPNPYRGSSQYETNANDRQIRFVNLPSSATIRIFTISGTLVREIFKPTSNSTVAFWDLENQRGLPVASGMYLVHVEARNPSGAVIGERVLKLGVVQRRPNIDIL